MGRLGRLRYGYPACLATDASADPGAGRVPATWSLTLEAVVVE